ncbi:hypothetical protein CFOL_v3_21990 [Cephalotus follicularis]|uniref:Zf-RVT domain-containing protein n=1 Tax=Cephalotus follicularis TaxID=3775 RepID=A0A1Q3CEK0_CEPFO|nr:hypothetical protein CFOL_v3_21990 [Cephalotus follicularis]
MWTWNKADILKLGWEIVTKKDSMWVRWCNMVLLRNMSFWVVKISGTSSWCWRNVLRLRECLARNLLYSVWDGSATALLLDPWINGEALLSRYGTWMVEDVDIPLNAKVSVVIVDRQ